MKTKTALLTCTSISSATRLATLIAATLLGCVHATIPFTNPDSAINCGIYFRFKNLIFDHV